MSAVLKKSKILNSVFLHSTNSGSYRLLPFDNFVMFNFGRFFKSDFFPQ